jgi:quercetin dioxygenase-like cupin family protein
MSIGRINKLIDSDGRRIVELLLPPEADVPWHLHSAVVEYCYCLGGQLDFEKEGCEPITLRPGEHCEIPVHVPHRLVNRSCRDCRFLIVQSGSYYDFVPLKNIG